MGHRWDPERYLTYADERGRPFVELVQRIEADAPRRVVDLGCGPENLTRLLAERWPTAAVEGIDSSPDMIDRARRDVPGVTFALGDIRAFAPAAPVDVVVANAALQWVPGHLALVPTLLAAVAPGGTFAFQVPANFDEPSHTLRAALAAEPRFAPHLAGIAEPASHPARAYLDALAPHAARVDAWETTYLHVLPGADAVFTWVSGTGARPTLEALPPGPRAEFEEAFKARLRAAYPADAAGRVILPFRRVFVVARR